MGPGKVGVSLGRYFTHKGITLSGFYGKNIKTTTEAANITKSKFYYNIQDIIKDSDILFITTPDDTISIIDRELSKFDLNNKSICHTSGSLKSNVLYNAKHSGALIYSIHPIFAFSNKNTDLKELEHIYFSIEGEVLGNSSLNDNKTEDFKAYIINSSFGNSELREDKINFNEENFQVINIIKVLGNKFFVRNEETSSIYHLANVFVSNLTLSLLDIGTSYLRKIGLNEKEEEALYKILSLNLLKLVAQRDNNTSLPANEQQDDLNNVNKKVNSMNPKDENRFHNLLRDSKKHLEIYKILGGLD
ncbi:Rossmann-like and DUF2520 domain-containing protein [Clostridium puniceum]|uniref:Rossmann-like and DUF2520 domain-containing protein n=1 Tax=Clostridium puniceum TaxID=29367 RepID=UPI001FA84006|nr:Rossmann-like and DUF2520 domain-containing protein [Clostridium puniceum]